MKKAKIFSLVVSIFFLLLSSLFFIFGSPETKVLSFICLLSGIVHPILPIYVIGGFGWMYLTNPGYHTNNHTIDLLAISSIIGLGLRGLKDPEVLRPLFEKKFRPYLLIVFSLYVLLLGSATYGIYLTIHDSSLEVYPNKFKAIIGGALFGYATEAPWVFRCLETWLSGICLSLVAYVYGNHWTISRFYKLAIAGTIFACLFGFGNMISNALDMRLLRTDFFLHNLNSDPLHQGRFYGTAGHAGWFAQWLIIAIPGLFIIWKTYEGQALRQKLVLGMGVFIGVSLFLTAARAGWLAGAAMIVMLLFQPKVLQNKLSFNFKKVFISFGIMITIGLLISWSVLSYRVEHLLRFTDRINYVRSSIDFLFQYPLGIGLGTHYEMYKSEITTYYYAWQSDFIYVHNLFLQLLTENGPFVFLVYLFGIAWVAKSVRKAWSQWDRDDAVAGFALAASLIGLIIIGLAQYTYYIKGIEFFQWIVLGFLLSISLKHTNENDHRVISSKPFVLSFTALAIAFSIITAVYHVNRKPAESEPYHWHSERNQNDQVWLSKWTPQKTRFIVDRDVTEIGFSILRKETAGKIILRWPDGLVEELEFEENESIDFQRVMTLPGNANWKPSFWMEIEVDETWTPAEVYEDNKDHRKLGVYISKLYMQKE